MESSLSTAGSVSDRRGFRERVAFWFLLHGNRMVVTVGIVAVVVLLVRALITAGVIDVGSTGSAPTLFGSGLTSGVVTLVTIALSINQLVLARVFGSPDDLSVRLDATRELRRNVENLAGTSSSPTDPSGFLSTIASALQAHTADLQAAIEASDWEPPAEVVTTIHDISDYGENIDDRLTAQKALADVLEVVMGIEYARNMTAVRHLQNEYEESLSADARAELQAIDELLESIAVTRQFFKTISLQQDFADLSRLIVYSGMFALLVAVSLTLVYRTNSVTVPPSLLPTVVSLGIGAIVFPLAVFVAYLVRAATIARRTLSVGPFVPPEVQ